MSGITVRSAFGKLQDILFSKDLRKEHFLTGQKVGSSRRGLDTISLAVTLVGTDIVESGSDNNLVKLTGHLAKEGDFLQINTTANGVKEFEVSIDEIVDANNIRLGCILSADLAAGDTVSILRIITPRMSATGATLATIDPSPLIFRRDGGLQEVIEDTATPGNSRPLPVKLVGVAGPINITAGDLEISTSHTEDSIAIGDGVDLLAINADGSINTLSPGLPATLGQKASAASLGVVLSTEQQQLLVDIELSNNAVLGELMLKADLSETQPVSLAAIPINAASSTAAKQDLLLTELQLKADLSETQPVSVASLPLPAGGSTSALQTSGNSSLTTIAAKDFATQTTLALMKTALDSLLTGEGAVADAAVSNPASSGSMIALLKGLLTLITATNTKLDTIDNNTSPALNSISNNTVVTNTLISAPANAIGMIVQNSTNADAAIRFTPSGTTPTASIGFLLGPGQSTSYMPAGSIRTISVDGLAIDVCVTWFV